MIAISLFPPYPFSYTLQRGFAELSTADYPGQGVMPTACITPCKIYTTEVPGGPRALTGAQVGLLSINTTARRGSLIMMCTRIPNSSAKFTAIIVQVYRVPRTQGSCPELDEFR